MSHTHYQTRGLSLAKKTAILHEAKEKATNWWVDILDCSKSFCRQKIDMPFEDIMQKLDDNSCFNIIHREEPNGEQYLEISFRAMTDPDYFLWLILDLEHLDEFTKGL